MALFELIGFLTVTAEIVHQLLLLCDLVKVDVKCFHTKYELTFNLI